MVMSRAIRSTSLKQPALFTNSMDGDFATSLREFIEKYNTVNQTGANTPKKLDPSSDIELSVNEIYRLSQTLSMSDGGRSWTESNSIIDSISLLSAISNELTLYDLIEPIDNPFVELNDYTIKLFENVSRMERIDQQQTYDYGKQAYIDNPAYNLGLEWQEKFHEYLMDMGFPQEIYSRITISNYWRVESLLNATDSMASNKFNFIRLYNNNMPSYGYTFDKRFVTEPLKTISKITKARPYEYTNSYYGDTAMTVSAALRDVAFANEFVALNPQIKTIGLTEISAYNHQSYYFKDDVKAMTKQNTNFLDVGVLPAFTTKEYALLSQQYLKYATGFMQNATEKLEEAVAEAKSIQGEKIKQGIEAMSNHWFEIVKHFYNQQMIDEIGLLYSNLLFPNMNPQNANLYSSVATNIKPIQQGYNHRIDLGDGYLATIQIYQQQISFQFHDDKYRNTMLSSADADFYVGVKNTIMAKGVPLYLNQPLNQILNNSVNNVNDNANLELAQIASRIYHIESQRRTKLEAIQERRLELARINFV